MGEWRKAGAKTQKFTRVDAVAPIRVSTVDPELDPSSGQTFFRSAEETTANLSSGGAFVRSWEPLAAGRRVIIELEIPREGTLQLVARVIWTQRQVRANGVGGTSTTGFGVEFSEISAREQERLDRYIAELTKSHSTSRVQDAPSPAPQL